MKLEFNLLQIKSLIKIVQDKNL